MAVTTAEKTRENRARRVARRQGLILIKSSVRDPRALNFGLFNLIDDTPAHHNRHSPARHSDHCRMSIDEVEAQLGEWI